MDSNKKLMQEDDEIKERINFNPLAFVWINCEKKPDKNLMPIIF